MEDLQQHLQRALKAIALYPIQIWQRDEEGTSHTYAWAIARLDDTVWGLPHPHGTASSFVQALTDAIFYLETIVCSQSADRREQQAKNTPIPTQDTDRSNSTLTADPWKRAYLLATIRGDLAQMNTIVQHTPGKDDAWRQDSRRDNILLAACQAFDDHDLPRLEQFLLDARDDPAFYPLLLQTILQYALEEAHPLNHDEEA